MPKDSTIESNFFKIEFSHFLFSTILLQSWGIDSLTFVKIWKLLIQMYNPYIWQKLKIIVLLTVCCQILLHCDFWWSRWWYQNSKNIWERDGLDCHRCNNVGYMIDWIWIKKDIWSKVMFISVPLSIYINFDWPSYIY